MGSSQISDVPVFDTSFRNHLAALFRWRRDVRRFRRDKVPGDIVDSLFAIADSAPSVGLSQPWHFVTVEDAARRAAVRANFVACNAQAQALAGERATAYAALKLAGLDEAPVHFAVFVDPAPLQGHGLGRLTMPETTAYSAVMAVHTLWLAARTIGLGLGWVSILDPAALALTLEVPPDWRFIGYFCLGTPAEDAPTPELERAGWEHRHAGVVLRR
jgi:5,6-dimethylbenzimidazole synthase